MRLFVDLDAQKVVLGPNTTQEVGALQVKRSPSAEIEVQFLRGAQPQELPSDASGIFEVKTVGQYDSSPLTAALAWVKTGTGIDTIYTFTLPLVNDPLDALLGVDAQSDFTTTFATDTFNDTAHGLVANDIVQFSSTVDLPTPLLPNTNYYVIASGLTADAFKVSATLAGSAVNLTDDGTGIHSWRRVTNDTPSVTLMAGLQWVADGKTNESQTLSFVLLNDVVREGDIPPAFPALVYAVFLPEITTMAQFKAVPTVGMSLGYLVEILIDVSGTFTWLTYRLESGPATEAEPQHVEPDDYDLGTNNVHWNGAAGPAGPTGRSAGLSYKFNTATAGAPGSGKLLLNNATVASATAINISEVDDDGNTIAALLATWDDSTSVIRGRLEIRDPATPTNFAIFNLTGTITDAGVYDTFTIAYVTGAGTFTNGLDVKVAFAIKGDAAATPAITQNYSSTTTDADPGAGIFRFNNATIASVTAAYLDNNEAGGSAITTFLDTLDDSTNVARGTIVFRGITNPLAFAVFAVTGSVVDGTGYRKLTLTHQASGGTFTSGELFSIAFYRSGNAGPGYQATSATSLLIGTGSKAFTTQANLAYTVGARVRATSAANTANWMEGLVTAYSSTTLTVLIDKTNGSGTFADWNINIGGEPGVDGTTLYDASDAIGAGTSVNIDWSTLTTAQRRTLTGNTTFTHVSPVDGKTIIIPILNTASNYTVSWVGVDYWLGTGGSAPVQSIGAVVDLYTFFYDGTYLYGTWAPGV